MNLKKNVIIIKKGLQNQAFFGNLRRSLLLKYKVTEEI